MRSAERPVTLTDVLYGTPCPLPERGIYIHKLFGEDIYRPMGAPRAAKPAKPKPAKPKPAKPKPVGRSNYVNTMADKRAAVFGNIMCGVGLMTTADIQKLYPRKVTTASIRSALAKLVETRHVKKYRAKSDGVPVNYEWVAR